MGVHDHHISTEWENLVKVFEAYGDKGFNGNDCLLQGVNHRSTFDWEKIPAYHLSDYFIARLKEDLPLSKDERKLYDFLRCYSIHLDWPRRPASDLAVQSSIVFRPERVKEITGQIGDLDLDKALEYYGSVGAGYTGGWPKERMQEHLRKVITFWTEAAARGDAIIHTEF